MALVGALFPAPVIGQQIYDPGALTDRALAARAAGDYDGAIRSLRSAVSADPDHLRPRLLLAETLAWAKRFREAEREYRIALQHDPSSHDAKIGLARALLWQGRYPSAREAFLQLLKNNPSDIDAAEGAATAAYWSGDYRTARRELARVLQRDPNRKAARQSVAEIDSAARGIDRITVDAVDDDQPYRSLRTAVSSSLFTDPLTRWDASAGSWWMDASRPGVRADAPFIRVGNETTFPALRLTATTSIGAMRYPDGTTRPLGSAALSFRTSAHASLSAAIEQYEMLATATAIDRHIDARSTSLRWQRQSEREWIAAIDARRVRYSDANRGWALTAYGLAPFASVANITFSGGASAAVRDTDEGRFYLESVSAQRPGNAFLYSYRGAYTPYWTPRGFREVRAIVAADMAIRRSHLRFQADGGVTRDRGTDFGPGSGPTALPPSIYQFEFPRTYHPRRLQLTFSMPISAGMSIEAAVERGATVFYEENGIRASLVRRR